MKWIFKLIGSAILSYLAYKSLQKINETDREKFEEKVTKLAKDAKSKVTRYAYH